MRADLKRFDILLSEYDTTEKIENNKDLYTSIQRKYNYTRNQIKVLTWRLKKLRDNKDYKIIKENPPDFYIWISRIWDWEPGMVQFWLSVFPALFIDIISCVSIAVVMFVKVE